MINNELLKCRKNRIYVLITMMFAIVMLSFIPVDVVSAASIPKDAMKYNGHSYYLYRTDKEITWTEAKKLCEKKGGHLVTINSTKEQAALEEWLPEDGVNMFFIGATAKDGNWKWITSESMRYSNVRASDIKSLASDYGCRMVYAPQYGWNWTWGGYTKQEDMNGYICEWEAYTLKIAESKINLDINDSTYIDYVIDGKTSKKITFKSSNTKVVKVSSKGKLVAKQAGSAKITVKLGYEEKIITVTVNPEKVTKLKAVSKAKKSIKLSWKKQAGITKYQVYMYDTDLEEYVKVKTVDGDFNVATISGLDKNTTYKFKVRAYVKSGSKNVYGEYSKVLKAKTKK